MNTTTAAARLLAATAVAGLALAGCASGADTASPGTPGASSATASAQDEHNDADVAFAQGMIPHHRQAVQMAALAAARTDNPQILDLAARIGAAQEPEIATMTAWLQGWGAEIPAEDAMGMEHGGMGGAGMGGMMTPEQMQSLEQASGPEFDRTFLGMMVEHHRGAVEMARTELTDGADPEALELAQVIVDVQLAEISEMEASLQQA